MQIVIAADPAGFDLKNVIKMHLLDKNLEDVEVIDVTEGEGIAYYDAAAQVARPISEGRFDRGLLFCGTGMGVSIVANKFPHVFCGVCESVQTARLCRVINDCNVLALGGNVVEPEVAKQMVDAFLETEFATGFEAAPTEFLVDAVEQVRHFDRILR